MSHNPRTLRIGTRASRLARWQADWVSSQLKQLGVDVDLVLIRTEGDERPEPIVSIGSQGLFTKEIQRALLAGEVDLAVHSLKDLPTEKIEGLSLAAVPSRADPLDVLISNSASDLDSLPEGSIVGTGSMRRRAQLLHVRPDLQIEPIRGNLETRLDRVAESDCAAVILAAAGLMRLELDERISCRLPADVMMPAIGQGALGLESRSDDEFTCQQLARLDDPASHAAVLAERALLAALRGGCLAPIGAWGRWQDDQLLLEAVVLDDDGRQRLWASGQAGDTDPVDLGESVAAELIELGALDLLRNA